jgi:thiosulfate dehydrogenase (quinone) large subunit
MVAVPFDTIQTICGHYDKGRCRVMSNRPCAPAPCPVLRARPAQVTPVTIATYDRRSVVLGAGTVAAVAGAVTVTGLLTTAVGHLEASAVSGERSTTSSTLPGGGSSGGASGTLLGPASLVPVGSAATFTIPSSGDPGLVVQLTKGNFVAYDAVCPHAGCTVAYAPSAKVIACPCHGSEFTVANGAVIVGPAPHGLTPLTIVEASNGNLYLQ